MSRRAKGAPQMAAAAPQDAPQGAEKPSPAGAGAAAFCDALAAFQRHRGDDDAAALRAALRAFLG